MKSLIIGADCHPYVDKKTGENCTMLILDVAKNNVNYYGKMTEKIIINEKFPLYAFVLGEVKGVVQNLVGYFIDVDKNNKGYLDNIEFLEKSEDAVIWGF